VARRVVQEGRRLARALERGADDRCVAAVDEERALLQAVAEAYPDRVVRRRAKGSPRGLMVGGRGVRLDDESAVVHEPLFVAVDVGAGRRGARSESQVRLASAVEEGWLPAHLRTTETELRFDEQRERVVVREARSYLDLELTSRPLEAGDPERVAEALCEAARAQPERALGLDQGPAKELLARWRFLHGAMRRAPLPDVDPLLLDEALPLLCAGRSSFAELRAAPVTETLLGLLSREASETLRREAPERLRVPSGRRVRLDYPAAGPPVLAAKIQELFGLRETPKVAGGRVPVMVHLLAPNGRPQQVTQDLRSFWKNTYPEVRKELRARYPKHHWPEKA